MIGEIVQTMYEQFTFFNVFVLLISLDLNVILIELNLKINIKSCDKLLKDNFGKKRH